MLAHTLYCYHQTGSDVSWLNIKTLSLIIHNTRRDCGRCYHEVVMRNVGDWCSLRSHTKELRYWLVLPKVLIHSLELIRLRVEPLCSLNKDFLSRIIVVEDEQLVKLYFGTECSSKEVGFIEVLLVKDHDLNVVINDSWHTPPLFSMFRFIFLSFSFPLLGGENSSLYWKS